MNPPAAVTNVLTTRSRGLRNIIRSFAHPAGQNCRRLPIIECANQNLYTMKASCVFFLWVLSLPVFAQSAAGTFQLDGIAPRIDSLVKSYTDLDIFSGVVLLAKGDTPLYHRAFGLANREKNIPNRLNTKFRIGSLNKDFTRVVVMQLIGEGKLNYGDRMTDLLPGFNQPDANKITIEHLLEHQSGFGDYIDRELLEQDLSSLTINQLTDRIREMDLMFPPGEEQAYSNAGYILLGAIIEKITGKSYAENVRERIVRPLQMKDTYLENTRSIPDRSIGYLQVLDGIENNENLLMEPMPDGGFYSTATDLLTFYRELFHGNRLLKAEVRENSSFFQMIQPIYDEAGAGIPLAGGMNGLNALVISLLKDDMHIIVLANMDEPVAEKIGMGILHLMKGRTPEAARLPAVLNAWRTYQDHGIDHLRENFEEVTANFHPADPRDLILNNLGYNLLFSGRDRDAVAIFRLNTELFPEVANVWDSYGEALRKQGQNRESLAAYRKALQLDPQMETARKAVEELEKN